MQLLTQHHTHRPGGARSNGAGSDAAATEDLLNANVLPHLSHRTAKVEYLAHLIALLLNYLFNPAARRSLMYDKDHMDPRWT